MVWKFNVFFKLKKKIIFKFNAHAIRFVDNPGRIRGSIQCNSRLALFCVMSTLPPYISYMISFWSCFKLNHCFSVLLFINIRPLCMVRVKMYQIPYCFAFILINEELTLKRITCDGVTLEICVLGSWSISSWRFVLGFEFSALAHRATCSWDTCSLVLMCRQGFIASGVHSTDGSLYQGKVTWCW